MLAEQLEQTTASLHMLQLKYDKLVDAHRILQSDLCAAEAAATELSAKLDTQTGRYKSLVEEMRAFNARAGVNVSLQLLAVLREVALAKEELASVSAQQQAESQKLAEVVRAREEIETLRADHARLQSENAQMRAQQAAKDKEHAVLLELLQAEVAARTDHDAATNGAKTAGAMRITAAGGGSTNNGVDDSTMKDSQAQAASGNGVGLGSGLAMNGHHPSIYGPHSSNGHAAFSALTPSPWLAAPLPASANAAPASHSSALHSIEGLRSRFSSPAPASASASASAAGSYSSAWAQQALSLSAARQQQQSQQARSNGLSSQSLPLPSPFLALPFTFAASSSSPSSN